MAPVFWGHQMCFIKDRGETVNTDTVKHWLEAIKLCEKQGRLKQDVILQHDDAIPYIYI